MANAIAGIHVYLALKSGRDRSSIEDLLILDGFNVSAFVSADELWTIFRGRPTRMVISERRFSEGLGGLDLVGNIRRDFLMPYCYIIMLSAMNSLAEIEEGLAAGVDDYLIKPHNPIQLRARVLVGLRWLTYIDSLHAAQAA